MSRLEQLKKKFLGFMTPDQINEVEVTDRGFVYKGNLLAAVSGLLEEVEKIENPTKKIEPVLLKVENNEVAVAKIREALSHISTEVKTEVTELPDSELSPQPTKEEAQEYLKETVKRVARKKK